MSASMYPKPHDEQAVKWCLLQAELAERDAMPAKAGQDFEPVSQYAPRMWRDMAWNLAGGDRGAGHA